MSNDSQDQKTIEFLEKKIDSNFDMLKEEILKLYEIVANQTIEQKHDTVDSDFAIRLIKATNKFAPVLKSKAVAFNSTKYKYAELDKVIEATNPALAEENICIWEEIIDGFLKIYLLDGKTGKKYLRYSRAVPMVNNPNPDSKVIQQEGSGMTYIRRYGRLIALSVASEDDDGQNSLDPKDTNQATNTINNNKGAPTPEDTAKNLKLKIMQLQKAGKISSNEINSLLDQFAKCTANKNFTLFITSARDALGKYAEKPQTTINQK